MTDDTIPPRQPNTPRVWWRKTSAFIAEYPDMALAAFMLLLAVAVVLGLVF